MPNLLSWLVAFPLVFAQTMSYGPPAPAAESDAVVYRFENDRFLVSSVDLEIDPAGRGRLVFARKGLAHPIERDIRVSDDVLRQLGEKLDRLNFFGSGETYQTPQDHSNLGRVTIAVSRGGARREVQFNYTTNREMAAVQALLRGIATRAAA